MAIRFQKDAVSGIMAHEGTTYPRPYNVTEQHYLYDAHSKARSKQECKWSAYQKRCK